MPAKAPAPAMPPGRSRSQENAPDTSSGDRRSPGPGRPERARATRPGRERAGRGRGAVDTPSRRELLLGLLRASPKPRDILSLAEEMGVHANTVRFHLEPLLRAGQVEQILGESTGRGRPPVLLQATHRMDPDGPTNYRLLANVLTGHLAASSPDPSAAAVEFGRFWGPHLLDPTTTGRVSSARVKHGEALTHLTRIMADLGFAPESPTGPRATTIRLRHCPFLDLVTVTGYREVICSLHLGLMQGALASIKGPVTIDRLDPFVEPDLCVAHIAAAASAAVLTSAATGSDLHGRPGE